MADKYETIGGVTVTAEPFAPASGKIPPVCVADGADWRFDNEGYRVDTENGLVFPRTGDWIVAMDGSVFVVGAKVFPKLFKAQATAPKASVGVRK